ncbi:hypothetical protein FLBR109950_09785 [Flavobacterium branchiophilum]|uniref:Uncharacterized protein n=1 Tax=Flavobacterium branchiophilum (strain FL-15) TaxID=1034807 RepID=G2Z0A6_FLABF|nr:hypothetical protein [Flavobacterium branchiophilum]CCB70850.1 Hypothetical protein FBFL15_2896 [Flavobacterium branchiophilum FL-15]
MKSIEETIDEVFSNKLFYNIGNTIDSINIKTESYEKFIKSIKSLNWENTNLDGFNELYNFIHNRKIKEYENWDRYVDIIKEKRVVLNELIKFNEEEVLIDIKYNFLFIILYKYYSQFNKKIPDYFDKLYQVYLFGNIPCNFKYFEKENINKGVFYYW